MEDAGKGRQTAIKQLCDMHDDGFTRGHLGRHDSLLKYVANASEWLNVPETEALEIVVRGILREERSRFNGVLTETNYILAFGEFIGLRNESVADPPRKKGDNTGAKAIRLRRGGLYIKPEGDSQNVGFITTAKSAGAHVKPAAEAYLEEIIRFDSNSQLLERAHAGYLAEMQPKPQPQQANMLVTVPLPSYYPASEEPPPLGVRTPKSPLKPFIFSLLPQLHRPKALAAKLTATVVVGYLLAVASGAILDTTGSKPATPLISYTYTEPSDFPNAVDVQTISWNTGDYAGVPDFSAHFDLVNPNKAGYTGLPVSIEFQPAPAATCTDDDLYFWEFGPTEQIWKEGEKAIRQGMLSRTASKRSFGLSFASSVKKFTLHVSLTGSANCYGTIRLTSLKLVAP
jgi:hypothetical protein